MRLESDYGQILRKVLHYGKSSIWCQLKVATSGRDGGELGKVATGDETNGGVEVGEMEVAGTERLHARKRHGYGAREWRS